MDGVRDIRPLYPVVPVKRRDENARDKDHRKPVRQPRPRQDDEDRDPDLPSIDEYV